MPTVFWHDNFIPTPFVGNENPLVWETSNAVCTPNVGKISVWQLCDTHGPSLTVTVGEVPHSLRRHPGDAVINRKLQLWRDGRSWGGVALPPPP